MRFRGTDAEEWGVKLPVDILALDEVRRSDIGVATKLPVFVVVALKVKAIARDGGEEIRRFTKDVP